MRLKLIKFFFSFLFFLALGYAFYIQVLLGRSYARKADIQHKEKIELLPRRGKIFDRAGRSLVLNKKVASIYILPQYLPDTVKACSLLAKFNFGSYEEIMRKILSEERFFWLRRKVDYEEAMKLRKKLRETLLSNAIGIVEEYQRIYPWKEMVASITGFVGSEGKGLSGIEFKFDSLLSGEQGWVLTQKDPFGREYPCPSYPLKQPKDGADIFLTIDLDFQKILYEELEAAYYEWEAKGSYGIIMDPKTGELLALVDYPDFDPSCFYKYPKDRWKLGCVSDEFEPGSVLKPVVGAICLEENLALPEEYIPTGRVFRIQGRSIHDVFPKNGFTFCDVFIKSSNIGVSKLALRVGKDRYYRYVKLMGGGSYTGVTLPGETKGKIIPPDEMTKLRLTNNAFGQGISMSLLQLAKIYSIFANNGEVRDPWIIKEIKRGEKILYKGKPPPQRKIFQQETIDKMKEILKDVVEKGTGTNAKIEGIEICGKTGTAQKVTIDGKYSSEKIVVSFVGFFPKDNPKLLIALCIDEPNPPHYSGIIAAPVFKRIARRILNLPRFQDIAMNQ